MLEDPYEYEEHDLGAGRSLFTVMGVVGAVLLAVALALAVI